MSPRPRSRDISSAGRARMRWWFGFPAGAYAAILVFIGWFVGTSLPTCAQGLLGKKYVGIGYEMARPNDEFLRRFDDWAHSVFVAANLPIADTWDLNAEVGTSWFDGSYTMPAGRFVGPVDFGYDTDITAFHIRLHKYFQPQETINPFLGIGVGYAKETFDGFIRDNSVTTNYFAKHDDTFVSFAVGLEWAVTDQFSIRPEITTGTSLEDFDMDDIVDDSLFYKARFIYWCTDSVFTSFAIGSDFDDTEVQLDFQIGIGSW